MHQLAVMPGLVPGIHVFVAKIKKDVDGRDKPGHDDADTLAQTHTVARTSAISLRSRRQAGPVATGGPFAAPHSVHDPSYSAGFSTPRR